MLQFYEYLLSVGQASFAVLKKVVRPLLFSAAAPPPQNS